MYGLKEVKDIYTQMVNKNINMTHLHLIHFVPKIIWPNPNFMCENNVDFVKFNKIEWRAAPER